ncbi:hypothetical protein PsorP6_009737 [Peronosclerospora sorghi]|uniref:Uncharacterized protein n=1 Tax=Peronosclerospora sorghi TaxID=230839 RepID=A0ACC0W005_9STRA|nr:hypothetical protein PsorP6_009737 [Peronosclerospora sorghi]
MLLVTACPSGLGIAAHLFRQSKEFLSEKQVGFSHIDDVKNGLLLCKPLEYALENFQLSYIYDKSTDIYERAIIEMSTSWNFLSIPRASLQALFELANSVNANKSARGTVVKPEEDEFGPRDEVMDFLMRNKISKN